MTRTLLAHTALLILSVALAFFAWTTPKETKKKEDAPLPLVASAALSKVHLESPTSTVDIDVVGEGSEREVIVTHRGPPAIENDSAKGSAKDKAKDSAKDSAKDKAKKPGDVTTNEAPVKPGDKPVDGGVAPEAVPSEPAPAWVTKIFPGAKNVVRAVGALAPLVPRRVIGPVAEDKLERMGLDKTTFLEVTAGGESLKLEVGAVTYGATTRYARLPSGDVVLIESKAIRPLEGPVARLVKRRVFDVDLEKVTHFEITADGRTGKFTHQDRQQRKKRFFATEAAPTVHVDDVRDLTDGIRSVRAREFLDPRATKDRTPIASFKFRMEDKAVRAGAVFAPEAGALEDAPYTFQAGRWVFEVSRAQALELMADVDAVLPPRP